MHKTTRLASLFGVLAIVTAACSSTAATSAPSVAPSEAPSVAASTEASAAPSAAPSVATLSGTLAVWEAYGASGTTEKDTFDKMVANVMAANPGLTVTVTDVPFANLFTNFETQAGAGSGPDLYIAPNDSLPKEARAGLLKDVSDLSATLAAAPYNTSQVALDASTVDGKLYEIPESMKAVELFYNNTALTTAPATTDDWMANASKLGWVYGANGGGAYYQWGIFSSFGGTIMDPTTGKCTADAGGVAASWKWLADMKAAGMKFYQNDGDAKADLLSGKIAGFIDGPWQSGDLSKALGSKLSVTAGPSGPGGAWAPLTAPDGFYINSGSANADLAVQFALQMLLPENEQLFANAGHLPASTTIQPTDTIAQSFAALMPKGFARPTLKQLDNYWGNFGNGIVAVIDKGTDPTKAVADACAAMNKANGIQ
jgi:arabinogalactan oligomer/maltooligosaccharide transport system substrate-binding protein